MSYKSFYQSSALRRVCCSLILFFFGVSSVITPTTAYSQNIPNVLNLPIIGTRIPAGEVFTPAMIKGLQIHPDNPLQFDFLIDKGDTNLDNEEFNQESTKLIKYFLASLTVPESEMWVNLSPYEKDRLIPRVFGQTEMGRDLLAQDYMLKQLSASLSNPDNEVGKEFWRRIQSGLKSQVTGHKNDGYVVTGDLATIFNKIWIVPQEALIYEHTKGAFIVKSKLKVMLEEDYLALERNASTVIPAQAGIYKNGSPIKAFGDDNASAQSTMSTEILREVLLPVIEREVNEGKTFANLRQIYNAVILASWYKKALKESLLGQIYVNQHKTKGVEQDDPSVNQQIYDQYVQAFKKGAYDYIKEDYDPATQQLIPRKYFSGGADMSEAANFAMVSSTDNRLFDAAMKSRDMQVTTVNLNPVDAATLAVLIDYPGTDTEAKTLWSIISSNITVGSAALYGYLTVETVGQAIRERKSTVFVEAALAQLVKDGLLEENNGSYKLSELATQNLSLDDAMKSRETVSLDPWGSADKAMSIGEMVDSLRTNIRKGLFLKESIANHPDFKTNYPSEVFAYNFIAPTNAANQEFADRLERLRDRYSYQWFNTQAEIEARDNQSDLSTQTFNPRTIIAITTNGGTILAHNKDEVHKLFGTTAFHMFTEKSTQNIYIVAVSDEALQSAMPATQTVTGSVNPAMITVKHPMIEIPYGERARIYTFSVDIQLPNKPVSKGILYVYASETEGGMVSANWSFVSPKAVDTLQGVFDLQHDKDSMSNPQISSIASEQMRDIRIPESEDDSDDDASWAMLAKEMVNLLRRDIAAGVFSFESLGQGYPALADYDADFLYSFVAATLAANEQLKTRVGRLDQQGYKWVSEDGTIENDRLPQKLIIAITTNGAKLLSKEQFLALLGEKAVHSFFDKKGQNKWTIFFVVVDKEASQLVLDDDPQGLIAAAQATAPADRLAARPQDASSKSTQRELTRVDANRDEDEGDPAMVDMAILANTATPATPDEEEIDLIEYRAKKAESVARFREHLVHLKEHPEARKNLVAVNGAGPGGLRLGERLMEKGYRVLFIEQDPVPSGLGGFGIPNSKKQAALKFSIIALALRAWAGMPGKGKDIPEMGVKSDNVSAFFNVELGKDISLKELQELNIPVVAATGAQEPESAKLQGTDTVVPGRDLEGIISATHTYFRRDNTEYMKGYVDHFQKLQQQQLKQLRLRLDHLKSLDQVHQLRQLKTMDQLQARIDQILKDQHLLEDVQAELLKEIQEQQEEKITLKYRGQKFDLGEHIQLTDSDEPLYFMVYGGGNVASDAVLDLYEKIGKMTKRKVVLVYRGPKWAMPSMSPSYLKKIDQINAEAQKNGGGGIEIWDLTTVEGYVNKNNSKTKEGKSKADHVKLRKYAITGLKLGRDGKPMPLKSSVDPLKREMELPEGKTMRDMLVASNVEITKELEAQLKDLDPRFIYQVETKVVEEKEAPMYLMVESLGAKVKPIEGLKLNKSGAFDADPTTGRVPGQALTYIVGQALTRNGAVAASFESADNTFEAIRQDYPIEVNSEAVIFNVLNEFNISEEQKQKIAQAWREKGFYALDSTIDPNIDKIKELALRYARELYAVTKVGEELAAKINKISWDNIVERLKGMKYGNGQLSIFKNRIVAGLAAALWEMKGMKELLDKSEDAVIKEVFAAAPSQVWTAHFLVHLSRGVIDWNRVHIFHMDEWIPEDSRPDVKVKFNDPESFRRWIKFHYVDQIRYIQGYDALPEENVHYFFNDEDVERENLTPEQIAARYQEEFNSINAPHRTAGGFGENGHIAFNDKVEGDAEFNQKMYEDPDRLVDIRDPNTDPQNQHQQFSDYPRFEKAGMTPRAVTLRLPVLLKSAGMTMSVPNKSKAAILSQVFSVDGQPAIAPFNPEIPATSVTNNYPIANQVIVTDVNGASQLPVEDNTVLHAFMQGWRVGERVRIDGQNGAEPQYGTITEVLPPLGQIRQGVAVNVTVDAEEGKEPSKYENVAISYSWIHLDNAMTVEFILDGLRDSAMLLDHDYAGLWDLITEHIAEVHAQALPPLLYEEVFLYYFLQKIKNRPQDDIRSSLAAVRMIGRLIKENKFRNDKDFVFQILQNIRATAATIELIMKCEETISLKQESHRDRLRTIITAQSLVEIVNGTPEVHQAEVFDRLLTLINGPEELTQEAFDSFMQKIRSDVEQLRKDIKEQRKSEIVEYRRMGGSLKIRISKRVHDGPGAVLVYLSLFNDLQASQYSVVLRRPLRETVDELKDRLFAILDREQTDLTLGGDRDVIRDFYKAFSPLNDNTSLSADFAMNAQEEFNQQLTKVMADRDVDEIRRLVLSNFEWAKQFRSGITADDQRFNDSEIKILDKVLAEPTLKAFVKDFRVDMEKNGTGTLRMINSHLKNATGQESGKTIAIDWGGTNLRVLLIELQPGKEPKVLETIEIPFTSENKTHIRGVFDIIAQNIKTLVEGEDVSAVGFTFSFPVNMKKANEGYVPEDIDEVKGWNLPEIKGENPAKLLEEALERQGVGSIKVKALLNDTVATLLAVPGATVAVIFGTGFNIAVVDKEGRIINLEAGHFRMNEKNLTAAERYVATRYKPAKVASLEKIVSGKYLSPIFKYEVEHSILGTARFKQVRYRGGERRFNKLLSSETISLLVNVANTPTSLSQLQKEIGLPLELDEIKKIQEAAIKISERAGEMVASAIISAIQFVDQDITREHTVVIDGAVYEHNRVIEQTMRATFEKLAGPKGSSNIKIVFKKGASAQGAGVAAGIKDFAMNAREQIWEKLTELFRTKSEEIIARILPNHPLSVSDSITDMIVFQLGLMTNDYEFSDWQVVLDERSFIKGVLYQKGKEPVILDINSSSTQTALTGLSQPLAGNIIEVGGQRFIFIVGADYFILFQDQAMITHENRFLKGQETKHYELEDNKPVSVTIRGEKFEVKVSITRKGDELIIQRVGSNTIWTITPKARKAVRKDAVHVIAPYYEVNIGPLENRTPFIQIDVKGPAFISGMGLKEKPGFTITNETNDELEVSDGAMLSVQMKLLMTILDELKGRNDPANWLNEMDISNRIEALRSTDSAEDLSDKISDVLDNLEDSSSDDALEIIRESKLDANIKRFLEEVIVDGVLKFDPKPVKKSLPKVDIPALSANFVKQMPGLLKGTEIIVNRANLQNEFVRRIIEFLGNNSVRVDESKLYRNVELLITNTSKLFKLRLPGLTKGERKEVIIFEETEKHGWRWKKDNIPQDIAAEILEALLKDNVMLETTPGGIDLNPAMIQMNMDENSGKVIIPQFPEPIGEFNVEGFVPVIINVQPVGNLPLLLGLAGESDQETVEYEKEPMDKKAFFLQAKI